MAETKETEPRTIFIVDDDRDIREDLGELLRDEGFTVEAAWNGAEALNRLQAGFRPDAIILDIMMPVMDGTTFRGELKKLPQLAAIPVIGLSAWPNQTLDFDCLQKPMRFETLLDRIHAVLP